VKLVIQIPCHNEAATLPAVLADLPRSVPGFESVQVLVVDDGSEDGSARVAREHGADLVVSHPRRRGLAAAFMTGLEEALALGADAVVNTDGDGQYPGEALPTLVAPVVRGEAELVIGDRSAYRGAETAASKRLLYRLGSAAVGGLTGLEVADPPSGFRALSRSLALRLSLAGRFSHTLETLFILAESGGRLVEVPVRPRPPTRQSRLFRSTPEYLLRSAGTLLLGIARHRPLLTFGLLAAPWLGVGLGLTVWWALRMPQALGLVAGTGCTALGLLLLGLGVGSHLQRPERLLLQELLRRVRELEQRARR
jgi:glycosyltransferase involved in cell wall biosynthesis